MNKPTHPSLTVVTLLVLGVWFTGAQVLAATPPVSTEAPRALLRFPDIHGDTIVFVHGEDIWKVGRQGGVAQRLTIHEGEERFPKISPDGTLIAFTGDYDGNPDVYVMNMDGGSITRLTYHPDYDQVVGWHPTQNKILFSSSRHSYSRFSRLFLISPDGTGLEELILHEAAFGSFSPDGGRIAYTKVAREHRTWKRYQGGLAQEIYLYDFATQEETNISRFRGTDRAPMWIGDSIYFSSDRDRVLNIYAYDTRSRAITRLTSHLDYDVRRPSSDGISVVYEVGGELWVLDTGSGRTRKVPIEVRADAPETRPYYKKVDRFIHGFDVSPGGSRALVVARGELFTLPQKHGPVRNLTRDSGSRDRGAIWSPDGGAIAYLSDRDGEYNIYLTDPAGSGETRRLTDFKSGYRHTLRWSPDSRMIAFTDQTLTLYILNTGDGAITRVDRAAYENIDVSLDLKPISDFSWSPDSRFIAYAKMDSDLVSKIYIYSLETASSRCVSLDLFNDFNPVFSSDGRHLFFVSNRRFDPTFCDFEWEMVYKKVAGIYAMTLRSGDPPLLPLQSDEASPGNIPEAAAKTAAEIPPRVHIDFQGIRERVQPLPLPPGNYRDLSASAKALYYLNAPEGDFNRFEFRSLPPRDLNAFTFATRKERKVMTGLSAYRLSHDGGTVAYRKGDTLGMIDTESEEPEEHALDLSGLEMRIDPRQEWRQIFNEAWRMERDYYYEPNMNGQDWPALKEKYNRMLKAASCRQDIRFIIGELIGELNTSHTYVYGGDRHRRPEARNIGMLGVDWEVDTTANRYRFKKIYRTPDWTRGIEPPLARPGSEARDGEYLLSVNGVEVTADRNVYSYFQNLADKQVTLRVNRTPSPKGSREIRTQPLESETVLRYQDWVEGNRLLIEEKSNGQIGYIHLPDTFTGSTREFPKTFYAQTRKKGLIIDGRFNAGGLDPDIFLQRLHKKINSYWTRRYSHDQTSPAYGTRAHMALLTNRQAGSGGDEVPYVFRFHKMGPVIGTRTWGGLVGVSMFIEMIDGGGLTAPDYRIYDPQGRWIIENEGVTPDIEVDLKVSEMARGIDAQLMTAIDYLMKKITEEPRPWPEHEPFPADRE